MPTQVRCAHRMVGQFINGLFETKCHSKACGAGKGVVVLHYFDPTTWDLIETKVFQDPSKHFTKE